MIRTMRSLRGSGMSRGPGLRVHELERRLVPTTFTVINTLDGSPAPAGSLRAAINSANTNPGADSITFDPAVFGSAKVIDLTGHGQLSVTGPVTITGPGSKLLTVKTSGAASATNRVLSISGGGAVSVSGVTISGGYVNGPGGGINFGSESVTLTDLVVKGNAANAGGGICFTSGTLTIATSAVTSNGGGGISFTSGTLSITNSAVTYNTSGGYGAGVYCQSGKMIATNVTISSNETPFSASSRGGGIYFSGSQLTIVDSTVANNVGGGLYVDGSLTMDRCTVSGNYDPEFYSYYYYGGFAYGNGGGIFLAGNGTITNSTISGNGARKTSALGGGIQVDSGTLTIRNSTVAFNAAFKGLGGGIGCATGASVDLESTIVSDNQAFGGSDIWGSVTANFSLISSGAIAGANNVTGTAKLGPLADNGGPARTHALLPGSPAIDKGANPAGLTTDQRGPGFLRSLNGGVDIGAVETDQTQPTASASAPTIPAVTAADETITVTYTVPTGVIKASTFDDNDITVTGPGGYSKAGHLIGGPYADASSVVVQYIVPPNDSGVVGKWDYADNGAYTVKMNANQVQSGSGTFANAIPVGSFQVAVSRALLVDEVSDVNDGNYAPGHLSPREAIDLANLESNLHDTISFSPSVFASLKTIAVGADMGVFSPIVINGPAAGLVLDANGSGQRIFTIVSDVSISNLTLKNGSGASGSIIADAGYMLTLTNVSVTGGKTSTAVSLNDASRLVATDCIFSGNHGAGTAGIGGSGYYGAISVSLTRCTIAGNGTTTGSTGGAISIGYGSVSAYQSTFSNNASAGDGGALSAFKASIKLVNCTLSGNTSAGDGGAVWTSGPVEVDNSTITGNTAAGKGGGIVQSNPSIVPAAGVITLNTTIVAGNSAPNGPDLWTNYTPTTTGGDYNLVGVNPTTLALGGSHNKTGTAAAPLNPMLAPLANNGGPTQTRALLPGSPAINAGSNSQGLATDQRGFQRVAGGQADIGAYESGAVLVPPPTITSVVVNGGGAQRSVVTKLTVTFNAQVTFAGAVASALTLTRVGGGSVSFAASESVIGGVTVVTLTSFAGSDTQFGSLADGRYVLTAQASQISANGLQLDGNSDGTGGDDYTLVGTPVNGLFRLFGDADGNGVVDGVDFGAFRSSFNTNDITFDFDGNGIVDGLDFGQFRQRFGVVI